MKTKHKYDSNLLRGPLVGLGISVGVMMLLTAIYAWLIDGGKMELDALSVGINGILFLSVLPGAAFAGRGEKGLLKGALCGAGFLLLLVCVNALFLNGTYSGFVVGVIVIGIASLLPAVLNKLPKKGNARHRRKKRNR